MSVAATYSIDYQVYQIHELYMAYQMWPLWFMYCDTKCNMKHLLKFINGYFLTFIFILNDNDICVFLSNFLNCNVSLLKIFNGLQFLWAIIGMPAYNFTSCENLSYDNFFNSKPKPVFFSFMLKIYSSTSHLLIFAFISEW